MFLWNLPGPDKVKYLKNSGAEVISLTAGTMHIVFDEIVCKSGVENETLYCNRMPGKW